MKKIITLASIATVLFSSCNTKTYNCISIDVTYHDTINVKSDNPHIVRYEDTPITKVGDTIAIWHTDTTASNYIVKSIK